MKLYCLSGLGVDHRAFQNLRIDGVELAHIPWIEPQKTESLAAYAKRLFESADLPKEYHLIGVSFGGMIAQEFEKIRKPKSLFLVSTISSSADLSFFFKIGGRLKLHKLIPQFMINRGNVVSNYLFGVKSQEDKELFNEILHDSDIPLIRWALGAIVQWKNNASTNGIRIHGGKDRILPQKVMADFFIPDAGHLMIATHAEELNSFLESSINMSEN
ncbi:MAG: alpha/beta fold hydrolase [Crocinitomicaceae bacterium]